MTAECHACGRRFADGETGWAEDVKVIEPSGVRLVTRYTCDDCEASR